MKYYYAFFRDNNTSVDPDGRLYKVVIKTKKGNGQEELLLSGSPFIVQYSDDDLYKGYKCSTATIGLLNTEYVHELTSVDVLDNQVILYRLKKDEVYKEDLKLQTADDRYFDVEWIGYTMPNTYDQEYHSYLDEFQLECQDALSVLNYLDADFGKSKFYTIFNIVVWAMLKCGIFKLYVSDNIRVPNFDYDYYHGNIQKQDSPLVENLLIEDISKDNNLEPRKWNGVLDSIMVMLNMTLIQVRDAFYIVSYDAIASGYNTYTYFNLANGKIIKTTVRKTVDLVADESAANDTSLSLSEVYSRFITTSSPDRIDYAFPDLADWATRIARTNTEGTYNERGCLYETVKYGHPIGMPYYPVEEDTEAKISVYYHGQAGVEAPFQIMNIDYFGINEAIYQDRSIVNVDGNCYTNLGRERTDYEFGNIRMIDPRNTYNDPNKQYICCRDFVVGTPGYHNIWHGEEQDLLDYGYGRTEGEKKFCYLIYSDPWDLTFFSPLSPQHNDHVEYKRRAQSAIENYVYELLNFSIPECVIGYDEGIVFNADFTFHYDLCDGENGDMGLFVEKDMCFQWMRFRFTYNGEQYLYVPSVNKWKRWETASDDSMCKVPFDVVRYRDEDVTESNRDRQTLSFDTTVSLRDTTPMRKRFNPEIKGYYVPSPVRDILENSDEHSVTKGKLEIIISRPWGLTSQWKTVKTVIENPKINIAIPNEYVTLTGKMTVDRDSDTEFSYKSANNNDESETSLSIVSWMNKCKAANILYQYDTTSDGDVAGDRYVRYLDYLQNLTTGDVMRPEEMIVSAYRRQYETPTMEFTTSIHSDVDMTSKVLYHRFRDKRFVVNSLNIDYAYDKKTIHIIEKK